MLRREATAAPDDSAHHRFLAAVIVVVIAGLWLTQLPSSLRLDETATSWIVRDGLGDAVDRAAEFQGESPLYFGAAWFLRHLFGLSEIGLRLVSVAALALATWLLIRLTERIADRETGLLAGVILAGSQGIAFAASDARPYALSILATVGAGLFLVRWLDSSSRRDAIGATVCATLAVYLSYFSAFALLGLAGYVFVAAREQRRRLTVGGMMLAVGILLLPAVPQLVSFVDRRDILGVGYPVSVSSLAHKLAPPVTVLGLALGLLVARARTRLALEPSVGPTDRAIGLGVSWAVVLPILFYIASTFGDTTLFDPRFFFVSIPGIAIVLAVAVRRIGPAVARSTIAVVLAAVSLVAFASVTHSPEEWREAAALTNRLVDADTPVLLRPGFIESRSLDLYDDPESYAYLLSPLAPYPFEGRITLVPYALDGAARRYLEEKFAPLIASSNRIVYVALTPDDIGLWFRGRLEAEGYTTRSFAASAVTVTVFER